MKIDRYILNEHGEPVPEPDLLTWGRWLETATLNPVTNPGARIVERTQICGFTVSTIFLGLDHRFGADGPPILWETMIFTAPDHTSTGEMDRCSGSREQALNRRAPQI